SRKRSPITHHERKTMHRLMALSTLLACTALASAAMANTAYVSNEKGNTISVIDLDKMETVATVPVGERPRGITLSHDNKLLYICTSDADHIEVLDLETLQVVNSLPSGPDPELFVLSRDGSHLYIANEDNKFVTVLDLAQGVISAEI